MDKEKIKSTFRKSGVKTEIWLKYNPETDMIEKAFWVRGNKIIGELKTNDYQLDNLNFSTRCIEHQFRLIGRGVVVTREITEDIFDRIMIQSLEELEVMGNEANF